jgi:hypothetical protein
MGAEVVMDTTQNEGITFVVESASGDELMRLAGRLVETIHNLEAPLVRERAGFEIPDADLERFFELLQYAQARLDMLDTVTHKAYDVRGLCRVHRDRAEERAVQLEYMRAVADGRVTPGGVVPSFASLMQQSDDEGEGGDGH